VDRLMKSNGGLDMVKQGFKVLNFPPKQKGARHTSVGYQGRKMNLRNSNEKLEKTIQELEKSVTELKKANQKILEQQKALIEEERLKVLLQMAGATAHELNQPLMALLCNIELMRMIKDSPEEMAHYLAQIEDSGRRIADIVKRIQNIRYDETRPYLGDTRIINLEQKVETLSVEDSDDDFETLSAILKDHDQINLSWAKSIDEAVQLLEQGQYDLILLDYFLPDGNGLDFIKSIDKKGVEVLVVVITGQGDEMIASQVIRRSLRLSD